jgi:hypothetical protein
MQPRALPTDRIAKNFFVLSAGFGAIKRPLWLVIGVNADEFTRSEVERLHQEASDAAQILDPVTIIGGLASDDFHRLVRLRNGDDIEDRVAITLMYGFSD